ncbi:PREDICTED: uncharacterized protein LOC109211064 [Nicotiana attenuata]|uniref:uncharacterized protein LOC109211064 n=1 Tax=Nicotiana attenuata TaxID=49451 RepID=UPI000904CCF5|nr:PREDICTED: uncharacterized protein LOC109211064 [Nicotiana attenuata]
MLVTHIKRLREVAKDDITFTEEYTDGLLLPHNDALAISLNVLDYKIKRVLVDPGSLANIIQWSKLDNPMRDPPPTNAEGVMKTTIFEVVDGDVGYSIILGRPWLHEMKVVPSTYHQLLKFPTPDGIEQIRGDQPATREMNAILVFSSKGMEHAA